MANSRWGETVGKEKKGGAKITPYSVYFYFEEIASSEILSVMGTLSLILLSFGCIMHMIQRDSVFYKGLKLIDPLEMHAMTL